MPWSCPHCGSSEFSGSGFATHVRHCSRRINSGQCIPVASPLANFDAGHVVQDSPNDDLHQIGIQTTSSADEEEGFYYNGPIEKTPTPPPTFDSTFHLVQFFRTCKNMEGLSEHDMDSLLNILFHPEFDVKKVVVRTSEDVKNFETELYKVDDVSFQSS